MKNSKLSIIFSIAFHLLLGGFPAVAATPESKTLAEELISDGARIHSYFQDGKLNYGDIIENDFSVLYKHRPNWCAYVRVEVKNVSEVVAVVEKVGELTNGCIKFLGCEAFFDDGKVSLEDLEKIGFDRLKKCLPSYEKLRVTDSVRTLEKAIEIREKFGRNVIVEGFNGFFVKGEVSLEDLEKVGVDKLEKWLPFYEKLRVTDSVLTLEEAVKIRERFGKNVIVPGFDPFFEIIFGKKCEISWNQLQGINEEYQERNVSELREELEKQKRYEPLMVTGVTTLELAMMILPRFNVQHYTHDWVVTDYKHPLFTTEMGEISRAEKDSLPSELWKRYKERYPWTKVIEPEGWVEAYLKTS